MTALPRAFSLLGLLLATGMLIGVGYLTHLSLMFLIRYALMRRTTGYLLKGIVDQSTPWKEVTIALLGTLLKACILQWWGHYQ
jgi:hypothetical protein